MKVKNINGTSKTECKCRSWLAHWEKFNGRMAAYCAVNFCYNIAMEGAHVQLSDSKDERWYIIPLCREHNRCKDELEISDSAILI